MNNVEKIYTIEEIKEIITPILEEHHIIRAGIFGSYAKGKATSSSDVDILVEFTDIWKPATLEDEIVTALGKEVDVLSYNGINDILRGSILCWEVQIYDARA